MERLGNDVQRELSRFGPQAGVGKLAEAWPAVVGEAIARNAWPARVQRDGTLIVHASSSAWAFELTQLEATIKDRLADLSPPRIRFIHGPIPEPDLPAPAKATKPVPDATPEDAALAAELTAPIVDEKLRKLVARAAAASLAKARSDRTF